MIKDLTLVIKKQSNGSFKIDIRNTTTIITYYWIIGTLFVAFIFNSYLKPYNQGAVLISRAFWFLSIFVIIISVMYVHFYRHLSIGIITDTLILHVNGNNYQISIEDELALLDVSIYFDSPRYYLIILQENDILWITQNSFTSKNVSNFVSQEIASILEIGVQEEPLSFQLVKEMYPLQFQASNDITFNKKLKISLKYHNESRFKSI